MTGSGSSTLLVSEGTRIPKKRGRHRKITAPIKAPMILIRFREYVIPKQQDQSDPESSFIYNKDKYASQDTYKIPRLEDGKNWFINFNNDPSVPPSEVSSGILEDDLGTPRNR